MAQSASFVSTLAQKHTAVDHKEETTTTSRTEGELVQDTDTPNQDSLLAMTMWYVKSCTNRITTTTPAVTPTYIAMRLGEVLELLGRRKLLEMLLTGCLRGFRQGTMPNEPE